MDDWGRGMSLLAGVTLGFIVCYIAYNWGQSTVHDEYKVG